MPTPADILGAIDTPSRRLPLITSCSGNRRSHPAFSGRRIGGNIYSQPREKRPPGRPPAVAFKSSALRRGCRIHKIRFSAGRLSESGLQSNRPPPPDVGFVGIDRTPARRETSTRALSLIVSGPCPKSVDGGHAAHPAQTH